MKHERLGNIDILKFVLSILILLLHLDPLGNLGIRQIRYPLLLCAVPMFFITSAFLFFRKSPGRFDVIKFVKRNLRLYIAWSIILFPITLYQKHYWIYGVWGGHYKFYN